MWNLTPDYLASAKEELKGRRAAIQARIADELKAIDEDIEEIETLERIAYAFAVKHLPGANPAEAAVTEPEAASEPEPASDPEPEAMASLQAHPVQLDEPEPVAVAPAAKGGMSRWRMRLDSPAEAEKA